MPKSKMTIDDLAVMLEKNSEEIGKLSQAVGKNSEDIGDLSRVVEKVSQDVEDLIITTKKGFDEVDKKFVDLRVEIGVDINKAKQEIMDYTDKRVGESEGRIIPKINVLNSKINTLTDTLHDKDVISAKDVLSVKRVSVGA